MNPSFVFNEMVPDWPLQLRRGFDGICTTIQDSSDPLLKRLIPRIELQQQKLAISMSREKEIGIVGLSLALLLVPFAPIFSVLFLPAIVYGFLEYRQNRKRYSSLSGLIQGIHDAVLKRHELSNPVIHSSNW